MSGGVFPVAKLGILALKQISKPIANVIKNRAKESLFFRQNIAMPPAHLYNWAEVKIRMWSLNMGRSTNIPQLNETMAIELGAKLLGEIIIFTIPAALLTFEYLRQSKKESKKEEAILLEKLELTNTVNDIALHLQRQDLQIKNIRKVLACLESRNWWNNKQK